jgi:hypothetical protein
LNEVKKKVRKLDEQVYKLKRELEEAETVKKKVEDEANMC